MTPRRHARAFAPATLLVAGLVLLLPVSGAPAAVAEAGTAPAAETAVDRLAARFDALTLTGIDDWKVSPDLAKTPIDGSGPARPGFDDAGWSTLRIADRLYFDSCWIRKRVVLPPYVAGFPTGGPLRIDLTVNDYGFLWVNGREYGRFDWNGSFELTKEARPGEVYEIAIKAVNTAGALQLLRADLVLEQAAAARQQVNDLTLSLRVAQKLLGFDTYQTNARQKVDSGIDRSTADRTEKQRLNALLQEIAGGIDTAALERGDRAKFQASVTAARARLGPIRDFVRSYTLYFAANAHIDAAWLWREAETIAVCKNTFSSVMNMAKARTDFSYTQSSAAYYDWMERLYPDLFRDIKARIGEGRWEVVGGMWVEPDCNLPSGTSWARQLLYGKRYFRQRLGVDVTLGWNPDSFGYNWNMPQFYRNAGIDAFITQKIGWNEKTVFPHRVFWWEAPDGSRILAYFPFDYVNTIDDPARLVDWLRQHDANTGFRKMFVLFGVGNHGGGPSIEMMKRIDRLRTLDLFPSIDFGTAGEYLGWLRQQDLAALPVWRDELYLEYHQGTFTTQAKVKEANRKGETLLTGAEAFSAIAAQHGRPYGAANLEAAWRHVMFNQFHDILPGSSIREVYVDAAERYREAEALGNFELKGALSHLAALVDTSGRTGEPIIVFNPLAWDRGGLVRFRLPDGDTGEAAIFDAAGRELPSQVVPAGPLAREVLFVAPKVPSLGYATFELRRNPPGAKLPGTLAVTETTLENEHLRVGIDPATGWVSSVVDKATGRETLAGPANRLQLLEDKPEAWDAWNVGLTGTEYPSTLRSIEVVERGPVRVVVRVQRDFLAPGVKKEAPTEDFPSSFFTQDVVLYAGSRQVDFVTKVDWWEQKTMLKVAFPVAVTSDVATFEIPYGTIERSSRVDTPERQAQVEVPSHRWADLSEAGHGVSLLNAAKYGYDVKGNTLRLSLLRSPVWPDPTADRGKHVIEYALYPHPRGWREAGTVRRGYELDHPLLAVSTGRHGGTLPPERSFVRLAPEGLVLASIKKAEDSPAWVVQWYDAQGDGATAELTLPAAPKSAVVSNILEADGAPLPVAGSTLKVPTGRRAMVTVKVGL